MSNAKHAINDFSEFCFALWKYLKSLLACPSRCSAKKNDSHLLCVFGDRGYIYRKMWIYFVLFCHSLSRHRSHSCVCKRSTFLHHFMSGRISCRFFVFVCERSPLPMFSCRLPNNKCVFFFLPCSPRTVKSREKNVWHKCLLATLYRFFAINFMFRCWYTSVYEKKVETRANDEYVWNDGEKSKQSSVASSSMGVPSTHTHTHNSVVHILKCCVVIRCGAGWVVGLVKMKTCKQIADIHFFRCYFASVVRVCVRRI